MAESMKRTPVLAGRKMSSSLKERLKRAGKSYTSPIIKKLKTETSPVSDIKSSNDECVTPEQEQVSSSQKAAYGSPSKDTTQEDGSKSKLVHGLSQTPVSSRTLARSHNTDPGVSGSERNSNASGSNTLNDEYKLMKQRLQVKEEKLRKLRLVKVHRSKNDLDKLEELTRRWKTASQTALEELWQMATNEPKPSLTQLVDHFSLDHKLIGYDAEEEAFS